MIFIIILNVISNLHQTIIINNDIVLNACDHTQTNNTRYIWQVIKKPKNSNIQNEDIFPNKSNNCISKFTPDKIGEYSIKLIIKSNKSYEELINILVLNTYKNNKINFDVISKNKFYNNNILYYKDKNLNYIYNVKLDMPLNIKNDIIGKFYIEDENKKTYLVSRVNNFPFYKNRKYKITLLKKGFKIFQTELENDETINIDLKTVTGKNIIIKNHKNEIIDGYFYANYNDDKSLVAKKSYKLDENFKKLHFYPVKDENNYPNLIFNLEYLNKIITIHKQEFYNLNIKIKEKVNILIKSKSLYSCTNDNSIKCIYQKRIIASNDVRLKLAKGNYEIEIFYKDKIRKKYNLEFNKDKTLTLEKLEEMEKYKITIPNNVIKSVFLNKNNKTRNIFFTNKIKLTKGKYNVILFTKKGFYEIENYEISSDDDLKINMNTVMINLYYNNILFNDFIVFENGYYININNYLIKLELN